MTVRSRAIGSTGPASGSAGLAAGAVVTGSAAALFGIGAFLAVVAGDGAIAFDVVAVIAVGLALTGAVAAALVAEAPGAAAVGMATVTIGDVILLRDEFARWWATYQAAIATSDSAENAFWAAMPAMGLFVVSGVLFALGAVLAALRWDSVAPQPHSALEDRP